jgi:2-acylglycerol O-acyltransferase 1
MPDRKSILFLTNAEFGQSNVVVAAAYELLKQNELDVHIASWPPLDSRARALSEAVQAEKSGVPIHSITFHSLPGQSVMGTWLKNAPKSAAADLPHPPGIKGAARIRALAPQILACWEPDEHIELYEWCCDLTRKLGPSLVVLDPFLAPAHDTCRKLKLNHAVLSPCTLASGLIPEEPWLAVFWKYPAYVVAFHVGGMMGSSSYADRWSKGLALASPIRYHGARFPKTSTARCP